MTLYGIKSLIIGYHSIFLHTATIIISWKKIYKVYPNSREFVCILLHDIGYLFQDEQYPVLPKVDNHPILGAYICKKLFGIKYHNLCIGHSREYAAKFNVKISKLCYADKYAFLILPDIFKKIISHIDGKINLDSAVENFSTWWKLNNNNIKNLE